MRRPTVYSQRSSTLDIALTPMIDVVFLLLVFFLWSTSFQRPEEALPGAVTASKSAGTLPSELPPLPETDFDEVIVRIQWEHGASYRVNEVPVRSLPELDAYLGELAKLHERATVIVHPDDAVPLGVAIEVYDVARRRGFTTAFATPMIVSP